MGDGFWRDRFGIGSTIHFLGSSAQGMIVALLLRRLAKPARPGMEMDHGVCDFVPAHESSVLLFFFFIRILR